MKGVFISAVIAVMIVVGSVLYTNHIDSVSEELGAMNKSVMEYLENEQYYEAGQEAKKLSAYLERKKSVLNATGDHSELDKIEMNLSEMSGYIDGEMQTDALSRSKVLAFLFSHLPKNYKLKLENIL